MYFLECVSGVVEKTETSADVKHHLNFLGSRGIDITFIHGDKEFERAWNFFIVRNQNPERDVHTSDTHRKIREVKDRSRCAADKTTRICKLAVRVMIYENIKDKNHCIKVS